MSQSSQLDESKNLTDLLKFPSLHPGLLLQLPHPVPQARVPGAGRPPVIHGHAVPPVADAAERISSVTFVPLDS